MHTVINWIRKMWARLTGQETALLRIELVEKENTITELRKSIGEAKAADRRVNFEIKAKLPTKIRVWYRENKQKPYHELNSEVQDMIDEIREIERDLESKKPKVNGFMPAFQDYSAVASEDVGLSRTAR